MMRSLRALLWFLALAVACQAAIRKKRIVGGRTAERLLRPPAPPPPQSAHSTPAPTAFLHGEDGSVLARVHGVAERSTDPPHYSFRGLRYAHPPVERFRFQRPRKLPLEGDVIARNYAPPCLQPNPARPTQVIGSEDCLFLNIYTPKLPDLQVSSMARRLHCGDEGSDEGADPLPVMVWTHGGGYRQGSANQYGPRHLVSKGIVVVTLQYRLGLLGFLGHGNKDSPGNAALCDQLAALEWVKEYIIAFGGDPDKVSLSGHDAGASAAMLLSQSKAGAGLFRSVVAMSGSSLSSWATEEHPERSATALARSVNCPTNDTAESVRCLQQLSPKDVIRSDLEETVLQLASSGDGDGGDLEGLLFPSTAPVVDGPTDLRYLPTILRETPKESLEAGTVARIPLLTGITRDETSNLFSTKLKADILKKMKEVPDYLDKVFLPQLVKNTKGLTNLTSTLSRTLTNYLGLFPGEDKNGPLGRLIEASGDALFALPAFLTSSLWTRSGGPVFLYSFDHPSPFSASAFSSTPFGLFSENGGDPSKKEGDGVGHGEDLFYLFEPNSLEGKEESRLRLTSQEDIGVLGLLTSMIANFVKTGNPSVELDGQESQWLPFSEEQNNYLSISSKPKVGTQFKFCQMGLWGGITGRLLSPECRGAFVPPSIFSPMALPGLFGGPATQDGQPKQEGVFQMPGFLG